ncbi:unnamed protein product [Discosporangium mesarthrocarpum]
MRDDDRLMSTAVGFALKSGFVSKRDATFSLQLVSFEMCKIFREKGSHVKMREDTPTCILERFCPPCSNDGCRRVPRVPFPIKRLTWESGG